jgi:hypothetical protein
MGGFHDTESYSSAGLYSPFGYVEIEKDGTINAGPSVGISTTAPGPYAEAGGYVEHSWHKDGSQSDGMGAYAEAGVCSGGAFGFYQCEGRCKDVRLPSCKEDYKPKPEIKEYRRNEPEPKKDLDEIARKVYRGEYGNGREVRKEKLEKEGYNYEEVQKMVNKTYYSKKK